MNPPLVSDDTSAPAGELTTGPIDARLLDAMQLTADPLADAVIARIVGCWTVEPAGSTDVVAANADRFARIAAANRAIADWSHNGSLLTWEPPANAVDPDIASALREYVRAAAPLPEWADRAKIARAETLFFDYGPLSCILLFCASLPECYVIPDLADVLHAAGQLEQHTDYRIRSTAAMIFPVMMRGGLTQPDGGGIAQILKVRLIHAMIRNLVLRGSPQDARGVVSPLTPLTPPKPPAQMPHALFVRGWNIGERGLPCNQEELAYTLLTFNYVFLRSLRQLGLGLPSADEEAYLHCWNVAAHVLGVRRDLMAETMADAAELFATMQARGRATPPRPDVRPRLGQALVDTMARAIRVPVVRHFPALMTYRLCGPQAARDVGVTGQAPLVVRGLFAIVMTSVGVIDGVMRLGWPDFSLSRLVTRVLGYHVMAGVLLDETRPLKLPDHLLNRIDETMSTWGDDRKAPSWINVVEDLLTVSGSWRRGRATAQSFDAHG